MIYLCSKGVLFEYSVDNKNIKDLRTNRIYTVNSLREAYSMIRDILDNVNNTNNIGEKRP